MVVVVVVVVVAVEVVGVPGLGVQGVGGHDHVGQVDPVQQCSEAGDFAAPGRLDLAEGDAGGVVEEAEQVDPPVTGWGAAATLPIQGDRPERGRHFGWVERGEPRVEHRVQDVRVQPQQDPPDRGDRGGFSGEPEGVSDGLCKGRVHI